MSAFGGSTQQLDFVGWGFFEDVRGGERLNVLTQSLRCSRCAQSPFLGDSAGGSLYKVTWERGLFLANQVRPATQQMLCVSIPWPFHIFFFQTYQAAQTQSGLFYCVRNKAGIQGVSETSLRSRATELMKDFPLLNKKLEISASPGVTAAPSS